VIGDILSTHEVERILGVNYDYCADVRAIVRHDAALRAELAALRRKVEAVEQMPDMHILAHGSDDWAHYQVQVTSRGQFRPVVMCSLGVTPWEALNAVQGT